MSFESEIFSNKQPEEKPPVVEGGLEDLIDTFNLREQKKVKALLKFEAGQKGVFAPVKETGVMEEWEVLQVLPDLDESVYLVQRAVNAEGKEYFVRTQVVSRKKLSEINREIALANTVDPAEERHALTPDDLHAANLNPGELGDLISEKKET